jgi:Transposase and inactivated derivatives
MKHCIEKPKVFFGADVASRHVDIACHGSQQVRRIANDAKSLAGWLKTLPEEAVLAMEATGRYHLGLARLAHERGLRVYVLNPRDVKHYARGVGQRGKTDRLDARLLARYVEREHAELHAWQPPSAPAQRLGELLHRRAALVRHKTALRQSFAEDGALAELLGQMLAPLQQVLKALEAQIARAAAELPDGAAALERITSVPGLGLLSAAALLKLFQRLSGAGADAAVAFTGLDPRPMDSGDKHGVRRLSKRGDPELRRLLFNAAMAASRTAAWRAEYERHRAKGLARTAALVALARKLVRVALALFKTQTLFDPRRQQQALAA